MTMKTTPASDGGGEALWLTDAQMKADLSERLFQYLRHGDANHEAWLKGALNCYFDGKPRPPELLRTPGQS
jgi:hypothetical protein